MAAQNLWFYRDAIFRIVEESLEVALVICNSEMTEFTVAKMFDLFNQILPTGFVLNTGYWPFYNTLKKQSLCICSRYGIDCRHFKHDHHWLDLESLSSDNTTAFSSRYGQLHLINYENEVTPVTGGTTGYLINLKLSFQYKKTERGRPRRRRDESVTRDQTIHVAIFSRYTIQREYYPAFHTIMFQPSPFFYESYGSYIPRLLHSRPIFNHLSPEINQRFYTVSVEHMPHFSLILQHVNLPTFTFIRNIHAIRSHVEPVKIRKATKDRSTQTEEQESITEVWRYKEIIGNLRPLWGGSRASSYESLHSIAQSVNINGFFNPQHSGSQPNQVVENEPFPNSISESILQGVDSYNIMDVAQIKSEPVELPSSTTEDKFYDVQWPKWGFQKALSKRRGRKKELYRDVLVGSHNNNNNRTNAVNFNFPQNKTKPDVPFTENNAPTAPQNVTFPSYATIVKNTKIEPDVFKYTAETKVRVYETYKDDPEFQWFERQCPVDQKPALLSQEEINENFTIAEESIRSDLERELNRVDKKLI